MIIWFTGQPGSGKTTLANSLINRLNREYSNIKTINIDGSKGDCTKMIKPLF